MSEGTATSEPATGDAGQSAGTTPETTASQSTGTHDAKEGQSQGNGTATSDGQSTDHVFDPKAYQEAVKSLPPEVKSHVDALYKSMQRDYTKKTQALAQERQKVDAFNAFEQNPHEALQRFATQLGYRLTPAQQAEVKKSEQGQGWSPEKGDPENWNQVVGFVVNQIQQQMGQQMAPMMREFQNIKKQSIEQQLNEIDPTWHTYEEAMKATLQKHPTMAQDPATLYRMSVPPEVLESRATQRALARMEQRTKSSQVGGTSSTTKKNDGATLPNKTMTFAEAVTAAKAKLSQDGIVRPSA